MRQVRLPAAVRESSPRLLVFALPLALLLAASPAGAWIYPEHRDIAGRAIVKLDPARRAAIEKLWVEARKGQEARLCPSPFEAEQGRHPKCLDWAAWPAISGDHSCSGQLMLDTVLNADWILQVGDICAEVKEGIATAKNPIEARNRLTESDLKLQRADKEYGSRAGANNVHFLLARTSDDPRLYVQSCVKEGTPLNAIGTYGLYHLSAMRLAAALASGEVPEAERPATARAALAAEAFGVHFLEDVFAAGHVAGCWGDVATRKGTHDYYNCAGLDARFWTGGGGVLLGDAHMTPDDLERASKDVSIGIGQLADALDPASRQYQYVRAFPLESARKFVSFNTCTGTVMPGDPGYPKGMREDWTAVLGPTPVPGRAVGVGSLPRFRADLGPFIGLYSSGRVAVTSTGLDGGERTTIATGALDIGARIGLGLEGVLTWAGDGQMFLQAGLLYSSKQKGSCGSCTNDAVANIFPTIPARSAVSTRLRLPFWLLPGDLVLAAPLYFVSPATYTKMGITAANGGLIPWQAGLSTFMGRLQFILGREVGATFYGYVGGEDQFLVPNPAGTPGTVSALVPVSVRSIEIDAPVVEVRPFRDFATTQAASLVIQLGVTADIPTSVTVIPPSTAPAPDLKTGYSGYLRIAFDWRRYF